MSAQSDSAPPGLPPWLLREELPSAPERGQVEPLFMPRVRRSPEQEPQTEKISEFRPHPSVAEVRKPMMFLLMTLGALPFNVNAEGKPYFKLLSPISLYSLTVYSLLLVAFYSEITHRITSVRAGDELDQMVDTFTYVAFHVKYVALPLYMWLPMNRMAVHQHKWVQFQMSFKTTTGEYLVSDLYKYTRVMTIAIPIFCATACTIWMVFNASNEPWVMVLYMVPLMTSLGYNLFWSASYLLLGRSAKDITDSLKQQLRWYEGNSSAQEDSLRAHRALWLELSRVLESQNDVSVASFSYHAVHVFVMLTLSLYAVLSGLRAPWNVNQTIRAGTCLTFAAELLTMANAAHFATHKFEAIQWDPYFVIPHIDTPPNVLKEITTLLEVTAVAPRTVNIGGFVVINRSWLTNIFGGLLSSLIILLQFKVQGEKSKPAEGASLQTPASVTQLTTIY